MASLPLTRPTRRPRSLTASASRIGGVQDTTLARRLGLPWQNRSLQYIDLVPEINYASRFYSRMLRKVKLYPGLMDDNENVTRIEEGIPVEVLSRIQDPGGGRQQLQGSYGRLMFSTGEGYLWGRYLGLDEERWQFVWNAELQFTMGPGIDDPEVERVESYKWRPSPRENWVEFYPEDDPLGRTPVGWAARMWTPHPAMSAEADCPMRACLDIAEELIILTQSVRSTAVTRLVNGVFVLPTELSPNMATPEGDEDPLSNPFLRDLTEHITSAVENPGTAAAAAPFLIEGAYDYVDRIKWMSLHDPQTDYMERELRKEAIQRLAYGLDMPPEALQGMSNANHWAAQSIFNDMWANHGFGVAQQFANGINQVWLKPACREAGFADWDRLTIIVDATEVTTPPDRSQDADAAADRGMIGDKGYRILKNIPEDFAPNDEEKQRWIALKMRDPVLLGTGDAQVQPDTPPPPGPEGDSGRRTRVVRASAAEPQLLGAAAHAVARCRELAGIRAKRNEKECPECLRMVNGTVNAQVAAVLGEVGLARLGLERLEAVRGGADTFRDLLVEWGFTSERAIMLAEMVEVFSARTLFERSQPPLPEELAAQFQKEES